MPQNVATPVLTQKMSEVGTKPHIRNCALCVAPFSDGKALEENEALGVKQIFPVVLQLLGKCRECKVLL